MQQQQKRTALVLSGGGAKGAYEVGVLEAMCEHPAVADSWSIITGTSIGAMNAGALAQYAPSEQCTLGLAAMAGYWERIKGVKDVFSSADGSSFECPSVLDTVSMAAHFMAKGGMCDASIGYTNYAAHVSLSKIVASPMELHIAASSLQTGGTIWFSNRDPGFSLDCIFASGALAPAMPPHAVDGQLYVDGKVTGNVTGIPLRSNPSHTLHP